MYYLYRHIRLDNNKPFYIGIGTCKENSSSYKEEYTRAFDSSRRSNAWKNIKLKTHYQVDILYHSKSREEIFKKEIEFIKLYGRKDLNEGTLSNFTDGGNIVLPSLSKNKKVKWLKNIKRVEVYQYSMNGEYIEKYKSLTDALLPFNSRSYTSLSIICKKGGSMFNYRWFNKYQGPKIESIKTYINSISKPITLINENGKINFSSIKKAARFISTSPSLIRRVINHPTYQVKGYKIIS